ncbi:hypothetical protein CEXT_183401 [Caerostris extrusa]|uniref:Uncharacterized protein n=1 Tax=Caerostris extrusa TaxID=172846 RepID=A0AAV4VFM2_CAEEX|nr:hypothetical protein CEXT_183401 [Caerostris extrusa]
MLCDCRPFNNCYDSERASTVNNSCDNGPPISLKRDLRVPPNFFPEEGIIILHRNRIDSRQVRCPESITWLDLCKIHCKFSGEGAPTLTNETFGMDRRMRLHQLIPVANYDVYCIFQPDVSTPSSSPSSFN